MHILHVITSLGDGGAEHSLFKLIHADTQNRHSVLCLTGEAKYTALLMQHGIHVYTLDFSQITNLIRFLNYLTNQTPDLIQTWMYHSDLLGSIVALIINRPVVWSVRNYSLSLNHISLSTLLVALICSKLSHFVPSCIIYCSQASLDYHTNFGYSKRIAKYIPNGFTPSTAMCDNVLSPDLTNLNRSIPLFGMVARFDPAKDHQNLLSAFSLVHSQGIRFRLVLVGSGMTQSNRLLARLLDGSSIAPYITLLGPRTDIPNIMRLIDFHVLSSASEAFPNVIAEAMIEGTPVISTSVGDSPLIIGDQGWIVPPSDPVHLASAIVSAANLFHQKTFYKELSIQSRQRILSIFSLDRFLSAHQLVWDSAVPNDS